ncbi:MAG: hypothetical protein QXE92_02570 [Thermofilaceae archaeon]
MEPMHPQTFSAKSMVRGAVRKVKSAIERAIEEVVAKFFLVFSRFFVK